MSLDREILKYMEDRELLKVCSINKKMWNCVCDDAFFEKTIR